MAKFNFAYVKTHPLMFGAIVVVFGLLFWILINGKGGATHGAVVVTGGGGMDPNLQAQLAQAQLGAQVQVQLAQLSLQGQGASIEGQKDIAAMELAYRVQELGVTHDINTRTIESSLAALAIQTNAQTSMAADNNAFMVSYARVAADSATDQLMIGAALQRDLNAQNTALQRDLGDQQLKAFTTASLVSAIGSLKKRDRAGSLNFIAGNAQDNKQPLPAPSRGGGGFNLLGVLSPVAAIAGAIAG